MVLIKYNLVGTLPSSIGDLTNIKRILLQDNKLYGTIPSSIGELTYLQYLYLFVNQLSGTIPSSFGLMSNLQHLDLDTNRLIGPIPSSFGQVDKLIRMDFASNLLTGTIPNSIGQMTNILYINLESNQFSGTIPSSFSQLKNLKELYLFGNHLHGQIPKNIGNINITETISLGIFSNFDDQSYVNQFTGLVPSTYCNYKKLLIFSMPPNNKTCFPICLYSKLNANYLAVSNHCPNKEDTALCDLAKSTNMGKIVREVTFPNTQVISSPHPIPYGYEISQTIAVTDVIYYTISFNGECELPTGDVIYICTDSNNCPLYLDCGSLPLRWMEPSFIIKYENMFYFDRFFGYQLLIVATIGYKGWTCQPSRDVQFENYAPDYCKWTGVFCVDGSVNQISLSGFGIIGSLPSTLSLLSNLQILNLRYNSFKGTIPSTIRALNYLNNLDLSNNKLNGTIPQEMDKMVNLVTVNFASNQLMGTMPISITSLRFLKSFSVTDNKLTGQITYPLCILSVNVSLQVSGNAGIGCYQPCGSSKNSLQTQLPICSPTQSPTASPVSTAQNNVIIIAACSVGAVIILLFAMYYWFVRRKYSKILFESAELENKRKQCLLSLPIHSLLLLHSNNPSITEETKSSLVRDLDLALEKHEDTINCVDFDGRSLIDIVLQFYKDCFSDEVLLLVLRKWFIITSELFIYNVYNY